ncbi:MAG TPA: metal ABC transporter permease [Elusimicrobiota bacterium]|nr:metal ABC transporter permease [Elusimicrobiota bacterium]
MNPFSLPFMQTALAASLLAGTTLSLLGTFILARRQVFSGLAVSQLAALGTVVGVLVGLHYGASLLALAFVGAGMFFIARFSKIREAPSETWVAGLYVLGAGLAVMVLSKAPRGESETMGVFFGNILTLTNREIWESLVMTVLSAGILWVWFPRWVWLSFDPISAEVSGLRVDGWNLLFYSLFAVVMTFSIHILGVLLAFAYLFLPAAAGFLGVRRMRTLFVFVPSAAVGLTVAGFWLSFRWDFPTGPFLAVLMAIFVVLMRVEASLIRKKSRPTAVLDGGKEGSSG